MGETEKAELGSGLARCPSIGEACDSPPGQVVALCCSRLLVRSRSSILRWKNQMAAVGVHLSGSCDQQTSWVVSVTVTSHTHSVISVSSQVLFDDDGTVKVTGDTGDTGG